MKTYLFFEFFDYYPSGGMEDYKFTFSNYEELVLKYAQEGYIDYENHQVFCLGSMEYKAYNFEEDEDGFETKDKKECLFKWIEEVISTT